MLYISLVVKKIDLALRFYEIRVFYSYELFLSKRLKGMVSMNKNYEKFINFMAEMVEKYGEEVLKEIEEEEIQKKVS